MGNVEFRHILIERLRQEVDLVLAVLKKHTGQHVNSTDRLSRRETKMTNGPTRATVHPYRSRSCRNNLQQPVAPRRQGPWVHSPSLNGVLGAPPSGRFLFGMPAQGPSRPLRQMAVSWVADLWYGPPLSGGRKPLIHSPRREVVSGPATPRGAHPTASGRLVGVASFWQSALLGS